MKRISALLLCLALLVSLLPVRALADDEMTEAASESGSSAGFPEAEEPLMDTDTIFRSDMDDVELYDWLMDEANSEYIHFLIMDATCTEYANLIGRINAVADDELYYDLCLRLDELYFIDEIEAPDNTGFTIYPCLGTITCAASRTIWSLPGSDALYSGSEALGTMNAGDNYKTTGLAMNTAGEYYYVVSFNGSAGYISGKYASFSAVIPDDAVNGTVSYPIALSKGLGFNIRGVISAEYLGITKVTAEIVKPDGTVISQSSGDLGNVYSYDLSGTINKNLKFGVLEPGEYTYRVTVDYICCHTDSTGSKLIEARDSKTVLSKSFLVVAKDPRTTEQREAYVFAYLHDTLGLNEAQAAGIIANLAAESSTFSTTEHYFDINGKMSFGIIQWNGSRVTDLIVNRPNDYYTLEGQLEFMYYELKNSPAYYHWNELKAQPNTLEGCGEAAYIWAKYYERCSDVSARQTAAMDIYWPKYSACANGHSSIFVPAVAATCTSAGLTEGAKCTRCGTILTGMQTIPALGHDYSYSVSKAPTLTAAGALTDSCSRCSRKASVTLPKLNTTDYTRTVVTKATVSANGLDSYTWKNTSYGSFSFEVVTAKLSSAAITAQPKNVTAVVNEAMTFSVGTSGSVSSYRWQYSKDGESWTNLSTSTNSTAATADYTVKCTTTNAKYLYRCMITGADGAKLYSNVASVALVAKPVITVQPQSMVAGKSEYILFHVEATGKDLTYKWQYSKDGGTSWTTFNAANNETAATDTYTVLAKTTYDGWSFRCIVTDAGGNKATSKSALYRYGTPLTLTTQPKDLVVTSGTSATFTAKATGVDVSYKWQYSKDGGKSWLSFGSNDSAATNKLVLTSLSTKNGWAFRCIVSDALSNKVTTETVYLFKLSQTKSIIAKAGDSVTANVTIGGNNTYRWQYSKDGGATWIFFNTTNNTTAAAAALELNMKSSYNGWLIRCRIINSDSGRIFFSNVIPVTYKTT